MIEEQIKMLAATIQKLYARDARQNIEKILEKTHVADIAAVLDHFSADDRFAIFQMEPSVDKRSEILSHLSEEKQQDLIAKLSAVETLQLVSLMESDDAADLLGAMSEEESQVILDSMVKEDSEEVADLMAYPEDSAGGIMSTEFLALNQNLSVSEAVKVMQTEDEEFPVAFYVYVINDNEQLVGVLSLKQLLLSRPNEKLKDIMHPEVISVSLGTDQEDVAKIVERYDFLSMPVTDGNNRLVGVVTVDDVIDVIREEAEEDLMAMGQAGIGIEGSISEHVRARLPWLFLSVFNGALCFALIYLLGTKGETDPLKMTIWSFASFLPILLGLGTTVGNQVSTVAIGAIRAGRFDVEVPVEHIKKELTLLLVFVLLFGGLATAVVSAFFGLRLGSFLGLALGSQVAISMLLGGAVPTVMKKLKFDPTSASSPIFVALSQILGITVLFILYQNY